MRMKALVELYHSPMLPRSEMPGNARLVREALNAVILWILTYTYSLYPTCTLNYVRQELG